MKRITKILRKLIIILTVATLLPIMSIVLDVENVSADAAAMIPLAETVDVTPSDGVGLSTWYDIDVSSYIPSGATGVIIHYKGGAVDAYRDFGLRKNGSTDNRYNWGWQEQHFGCMVGVDTNRVFEYYRVVNGQKIYLVGYTTSSVTFFTDAVYAGNIPQSPEPDPEENWVYYEVDVSSSCPDAIGLILEYQCASASSYGYVVWKKGSTSPGIDIDITRWSHRHTWVYVGVDTSQIFCVIFPYEWSPDPERKLWIVGYVTDGAVFKTNPDDISLPSAGSYQEIDLSSEAPNGRIAIIDVHDSKNTSDDYALRMLGETGDDANIYNSGIAHVFSIVQMDTDGKIEGKIADTDTDFWLIAYSAGAVLPTVTTNAATNVEATYATLNGEVTDDGGGTIDERGFEWGTSTGVYDYSWEEYGAFGETTFSRTIYSLTSGQTYYFRSFAHNDAGYSYGSELNFTAGISAPDIDTEEASNVTVTTARLNSTVTDDGGDECEVRFGYDTSTQSSFEDYAMTTAWVDGYYEGSTPYATITGLGSNQTYYFRAQIKNTDSTVASSTEKSFTTATQVGDVTNLYGVPDCDSITLVWTKAPYSLTTMIRYRTDAYPADIDDGTLAYNSTSFHTVVSGLDEGQSYYFSAWGYDAGYSTTEANLILSTLICLSDSDMDDALDIELPDNINQDPDMSGFQLEPFTTIIAIFNQGFGMPEDNVWEVVFLLFIVGVALITYIRTKNFFVAFFILIVLTMIGVGVKLTQGWLVYVEFIIGAGVWAIEKYLQ